MIPADHAARIITVHDLDFLDHLDRTVREIRRDYVALAPSHIRRADHIIANSETTANDVRARFGIDPSRMTVCTPGAPSWPAREVEPTNGCILFLGALDARKNLELLLDAYERVLVARPDAPPLVLGGRPSEESDNIKLRATLPNLRSAAIWTHPVVANGRLYLRDQELIFCYEVK